MKISLIYARSENGCIGKSGGLPWRLPDESRFFEDATRGIPVIMGRKTYEDHHSVLPGRLNIVITRAPGYAVADGVCLADSLQTALDLAARRATEAFVIGGVRPLVDAMPFACRVYETIVHAIIDGDAYLPDFTFDGWQSRLLQYHPPDPRHRYSHSVFLHQRDAAGSTPLNRGPDPFR